MKLRLITALAGAALSCSLALHAQPSYRITPVDPRFPDGRGMILSDVNENNEMAGTYTPDGLNRSILWRDGRIIELPDLVEGHRGEYAEALGLNDYTEVVGVSQSSEFPNQLRGYLWRRGRVRDIGALAGEDAVFPTRINNRGQIAGSTWRGDPRTFLWENGVMRILPSLLGPAGISSPGGINELGHVVGTSESPAGFRGVLWRDGRVIDLGTLPGSFQSQAFEITNKGRVVMLSNFAGFPPKSRGWIWERGQQRVLPMLHPDDVSSMAAQDINERGQIVGWQDIFVSPDQAAEIVPLLWQDGNVYDLHDLIDEDDPLRPFARLLICSAINDRGVILVNGRDSRRPNVSVQYILTPVHE